MGILSDKQVANWGNHSLEVRACNFILRGLLYQVFIDGSEVARAQNFWKIPTQRRLDAQISLDGAEHHLVVWVTQRWLNCDFSAQLDGHALTLHRVS